MFAIVLCAVAVSADPEPPTQKEPPRFVLVKLEGDQLVSRATVPVSRAVKVKKEFNNNGKIEVREVVEYVTEMRVIERAWDLKNVTVTTAGGKKLDLDAVKKRLTKPQVVVFSGDGKAVDESYLKVLDKDALVIVPKPDKGEKKE